MPSSATRARLAAERAVATISPARCCARAPRAIEPPISPKPISATRWNSGASLMACAMNSRSASITSSLASSVPIVIRSACGRP